MPAEKVETVVDVGDQGLLRRQAQAHRGQDPGDLLPQGFSVVAATRDRQAPVVGVPDQPIVGQAMTAAPGPFGLC